MKDRLSKELTVGDAVAHIRRGSGGNITITQGVVATINAVLDECKIVRIGETKESAWILPYNLIALRP